MAVIKRLPKAFSPYTKLQLYCTFVRPVLEYASLIFDDCSDYLSEQLESIQRQAMLAATRAYKRTPTSTLLKECGLLSLKSRRTIAKLTLFHKIMAGKAPGYLQELVPGQTGDQIDHVHNLRNSQDLRLSLIKKNYFLKSYIPSTVRAWNSLSANVKSISTVDTFKLNLNKIYGKLECYKPYLSFSSCGHIHLSRIRMGLSGLNAQRHKFHLTDVKICGNCNYRLETDEHFLFFCPAYAAPRQDLLTQLKQILPDKIPIFDDLKKSKNKKEALNILLFGIKKREVDTKIFSCVSLYIEKTNRFDH